MSSRHFATAAISARAESFTADGAMPSAQFTVESAVALFTGVLDHLKTGMNCSENSKSPTFVGPLTVLCLVNPREFQTSNVLIIRLFCRPGDKRNPPQQGSGGDIYHWARG